MMHVLMLTIVIMGVEAVEVKKRAVTFPGQQSVVNGSSSVTVSKPASSVLHCGRQCLTDGDCVVANYEDAGVCHMLATGPISLENIILEDNNHMTAILPESLPANSLQMIGMVGWWPLQEASGGKDLSGHGYDIALHDITFPDDGVTPWASPAAYFKRTVASYGHIQHGQHLDVESFSWMAKVYPQNVFGYNLVFSWNYNGAPGVYSYFYWDQLFVRIKIPGCSLHDTAHPTEFSLDAWHTMAITYDFPTNNLTLWLNGTSHVSTEPACGTNIETSPELYIGKRSDNWLDPFHGRLSCMSLYNTVVDYDVMYAATMSHCGGE